MLFRFLFLLLSLFVWVLLPEAHGQEADTTELPEIAPREIEIRRQRQIALPSLERQPLTGFARPPRPPTVPPDRRPYVETYEQELDDLPESLPLPETIAEPLAPTSTSRQGFLEGGGGRYYNRFFEGRLQVPASSSENLLVHGTYTGTEGFTPLEGDSIDTPSDVATAQVRLESTRDPIQVSAELHGSAERYTLYGVTPASEQADREAYSVGTSAQLTSRGTVPARATVRYDRTQYTSHLAMNAGNGVDFRQGKLGLSGSITAPVTLRPHLDASYSRSWLGGTPLDDSDTAFGFDGAGTLSVFRTDSSSVEVGARVLAFATPARPSEGATDRADATYVTPVANVEWRLAEGVTLHLRNQPRRVEASLHRLYEENPYAMHAPSLRPTLETTNAETGLALVSGLFRFVAAAGYRYAPTYQFFEPGGQGGFTDGVFGVHYESARILRGRGQIALQGIDGVQASVGVSLRDGSLGDEGTIIPNFAPVTADAMLTVSFSGGDGFFKVLSHYESPRYASRNEENRLDSYFTLDFEGSYSLSSSIELLVRAENLAFQDPTLWAGYPRPPSQISSGLRIRW